MFSLFISLSLSTIFLHKPLFLAIVVLFLRSPSTVFYSLSNKSVGTLCQVNKDQPGEALVCLWFGSASRPWNAGVLQGMGGIVVWLRELRKKDRMKIWVITVIIVTCDITEIIKKNKWKQLKHALLLNCFSLTNKNNPVVLEPQPAISQKHLGTMVGSLNP